ncbi:peptidoglycan DD-metalloendopeptidase family protein [Nostocaceae cyanobacterium CENA357]|uniref:Peptidoglycan DD-metalloendopeptidase family protein n=1 Tax=Atlanticothrix silvestris CENA357 TaxID=1725252 RepID=A0A8J7H5N8_9CYAN|nr:peptidoglycan DD-metalloendopeptidase family protein [Atlanticothrix silvestris]MBH8551024.1 peptidoglycan DD-metalloendopeptidase family protein [Atlanticothrix silvestris CENA357]
MTQRNNSAQNRLHNSKQQDLTTRRFSCGKLLRIYLSTLPAQSFCLLSSVSFLSGGLALAQTESSIDNIVPTIENSQPTAATIPVKKDTAASKAVRSQPSVSQPQTKLRQKLRRPEAAQSAAPVRQLKPKVETEQSAAPVRQSKPKVETEPVVNIQRSGTQAENLRVSPVRISEEKPQVEFSQPKASVADREEKPKIEVAKPTAPRSLPERLPQVAQPSKNSNNPVRATAGKTKDYNNAYIDPTNYNTDTAATYQAPNSVILTERSSGCRTTLSTGQGVSGGNCAKAPQTQRLANQKPAPNWLKKSQTAQLASTPPVRQVATTGNSSKWRATGNSSTGVTKTAYRPNRFIPNPSNFATTRVNASPIAPSGGTLPPPMADGNIAPRPSTVSYDFALASVLPQIPFSGAIAYRGSTGMVYPLSVAAPITSLFGWRVHPITGDRRFHAGTDLGAPMGTPILAAAKGQVETADWKGGYGLTVTVNHTSAQQTLYGHMSEIFVQPGQWVEPGTVIGRVGSTGNSTGPHLHFEVRHLTQKGWVAVDPGVQLQIALGQLVQTLQTAQLPQQPGS